MRIFTLFLSFLLSSAAIAQPVADGYYRVKNKATSRYVYVMDDRGSINYQSSSADVAAINLWSGHDRIISDPATVIYLKNLPDWGKDFYDLQSQGTGTYQIISNPVKLRKVGDAFWCYASKSGMVQYLYDMEDDEDEEQGLISTTSNNPPSACWYIEAVSETSDNYFGITPSFTYNGKHYASFYAAFPFSFASAGMKAYKVVKNNANKAVLQEITAAVIPASTPVLIECSSAAPTNNRLKIGGSGAAVTGNLLSGNFFCYDPWSPQGKVHPHKHVTEITSTMRVFGVTSNGKLGLVKPTGAYLPANSAYLNSSVSGLASELVFVSDEEFSRVDVTGVSLNKTTLNLKKGATETLVATITPENATNKNVTWTTSNANVATVSNGVVTAVGAGNAVITVTTSNGKTATCNVTVTVDATGVTLNKTTLNLKKGASETLVATVSPDDATDKTVTWATSNANVATVSNGVVTAVGAGNAVITVTTSNGKTATCNVTVTVDATGVTLNKTTLNLKKGASETLVATVTPSDATDKTVTWATSNANVATVSNGVVTAVGAGNAVITVTTSNGKTATCNVTVTVDATGVTLNKTTLNLKKGASETLVATVSPDDATDKTVTWSTSNANVATVSNGVVTAVGAGDAVITVTTAYGQTATCNVTVTVDATGVTLNKTTLNLKKGASETLVATVSPDDATDKTVTWATSNANVATVSNGVVTAVGAGDAVITVTTAYGQTATCNVTVTVDLEKITLSETEIVMEEGSTKALTVTFAPEDATDKTVVWTSDNESVAAVSDDGVVTAVAVGMATITVTSANGLTATCVVEVQNNSAINGISLDGKGKNAKVYTIGGLFVGESTEKLANGLYIKGNKKVLLKK